MGELYSDEIEVRFERQPLIEKRPGLPSAFTWRAREYIISELLEEWHDYRPRGRSKCMYEKERGHIGSKAPTSEAPGASGGTATG